MSLEIEGNTINGMKSSDYAIEIANVWDTASAVVDGYVSSSGAALRGCVYASNTANGVTSKTIVTMDLLPLLFRTHISFTATACVSGTDLGMTYNDSYLNGWRGRVYVRLTDGTNTSNLLYCIVDGTSNQTASAGAGTAFISATINLSLAGDTLTVGTGGYAKAYGEIYDSAESTTPTGTGTATLATDGSTVDISTWSALKIEVRADNTYDFKGSGMQDDGITFASMSPIMMINSKYGSNKTE